jgi:hypothetical protein
MKNYREEDEDFQWTTIFFMMTFGVLALIFTVGDWHCRGPIDQNLATEQYWRNIETHQCQHTDQCPLRR